MTDLFAKACNFFAAGNNAGPISASPGMLVRIIVTALGTATTTFYDSLTGSGNVLFIVPASAPVGTIYTLELPTNVGIYCQGQANSPGLTVAYI